MATVTESVHYRTSDMALVSYLKFLGHEPQQINWENGTCYWLFRETPHLLEGVDQFAGNKALIEPKEYNRLFGMTKREFFDSEPNPNRR
jgi:hypothetical protein